MSSRSNRNRTEVVYRREIYEVSFASGSKSSDVTAIKKVVGRRFAKVPAGDKLYPFIARKAREIRSIPEIPQIPQEIIVLD